MAFKPGQSGNPGGRPATKPFLDALNRAIAQKDGVQLRAIAEKLLSAAEAGEPWAVQLLADRLDGKARQEVSADLAGTVNLLLMQADAGL